MQIQELPRCGPKIKTKEEEETSPALPFTPLAGACHPLLEIGDMGPHTPGLKGGLSHSSPSMGIPASLFQLLPSCILAPLPAPPSSLPDSP